MPHSNPSGTYATACLLCNGDGRESYYLGEEDNGACPGCLGSGESHYRIVRVGACEYEMRELGVQREVFG